MTHDLIGDAKASAERGDFESAVTVLRPMAEAGNRDAQHELALLALTECNLISGYDRDLPAARDWLRRAIAGGYEYADGLLAHLDSL